MELLFTITPAHTESRLRHTLQREAQRGALLQARLARWQTPLFFCLSLGGCLLYLSWLRPSIIETSIAMLLVGALGYWLWRRYATHLQNLRMRLNQRRPLLQGLLQAAWQRRLQRQEGLYRLQLDDIGFTLIHCSGTQARVEWAQIVRLQTTPDFYRLSTAALAAKDHAYHLPRYSEAMDATLYQEQLAQWLKRCACVQENAIAAP